MNWYAMKLEGQLRHEEMIRKAAEYRRASIARKLRPADARPAAISTAGTDGARLGVLQMAWRRLLRFRPGRAAAKVVKVLAGSAGPS